MASDEHAFSVPFDQQVENGIAQSVHDGCASRVPFVQTDPSNVLFVHDGNVVDSDAQQMFP